jgi:DNA-binding response OmpR family regulator
VSAVITSRPTVLVADDDPDLAFTLGTWLEADGYRVFTALDGQSALRVAARVQPNLVVLDLVMPLKGGSELARRLKRLIDTPIIVLTALDDEESRVTALELYADDYVTKPFSYRELRARIKHVLDRTWPDREPEVAHLVLEDGVEVDFARREMTRPGQKPIRLSPTEARLLSLLLRNAGRVLPNALLLDRAWPDGGGSTPALWEYIRRLRQKLEDAGLPPRAIRTERGIGYRLRL